MRMNESPTVTSLAASDTAETAARLARLPHPGTPVLATLDDTRLLLTWVHDGALQAHALPLGLRTLGNAHFRHQPARPVELEAAIDTVEDALMRPHPPLPAGRVLWPAGAFGCVLPLVAGATREDVEALFQQFAAVSLGRPGAGLPQDAASTAAILVLRELMHHLDFARWAAGPPDSSQIGPHTASAARLPDS